MISKKFILPLLALSLIFIAGCGTTGNVINLKDVSKEDVNKIIVCDTPYMRFESGCCLDANNNKICDKDENKLNNETKIDTSTEKQQEKTSGNVILGSNEASINMVWYDDLEGPFSTNFSHAFL